MENVNTDAARLSCTKEPRISELLRTAVDDFEWLMENGDGYGGDVDACMADWITVGAKDDRDSAKQICSVCLGGAVLWRRGFVHRDNLEAFGERGVEALVGPIRGVVNNLDVIDSVRKGDIVNAIRYSAGADRFIRSPWREERDHLTEAVTLWFEQNRTAATDLQLTAALLTASAEAEARRTFDDPEAAGTAPPAGPGGQAGGRTGGFADPLPRLAADRLRGLTGPLNDPAANTFYDPNDERMERGDPRVRAGIDFYRRSVIPVFAGIGM